MSRLLKDVPVPRLSSFCDLGVVFDEKLSFVDHVNNLLIVALNLQVLLCVTPKTAQIVYYCTTFPDVLLLLLISDETLFLHENFRDVIFSCTKN